MFDNCKRCVIALAAALAIGGYVQSAQASDVFLDNDTSEQLTNWDTVVLNSGSFTFGNGSNSVEVYDGAVPVTHGVLPNGDGASWIMFCVDVQDFSTAPPSSFTGAMLGSYITNAQKKEQIASLVDFGTKLLSTSPSGADGYSYAELSAGLQIAIWTAENQTGTTGYDPTDDSRGFWISSPSNAADIAAAQVFLNDVTDGTWSNGNNVTLLRPYHPPTNQYFAVYEPTGNNGEIIGTPEPASVAVFGVGLLGFGFIRRRRRA